METPLNGSPVETSPKTDPSPVPRIVQSGAPSGSTPETSESRVARYRERYPAYSSQLSRARQLQLDQTIEQKRPPSVFLTPKFWRGFLFIGVLNMAAFLVLRGADASWLIKPLPTKVTQVKAPAFQWPKGMVPLQVERSSDGELLITIPTRTLTPEEEATLKRLWETRAADQDVIGVRQVGGKAGPSPPSR